MKQLSLKRIIRGCGTWFLANLSLAAAIMLCVGCQPKNGTVASSNAEGTFGLVSVDGHQLPCTTQHEGAQPTIKSGSLTFNSDGTCLSKINFSVPPGKDLNREVKATYQQQGSELKMNWVGAGTTTGTLQSNTFTMNNEGIVFVYRK
jgi:hypothetical protein